MTEKNVRGGRASSGRTRLIALLAAMAPLVAGVYQESQDARQRKEQRYNEAAAQERVKAEKVKEEALRKRDADVSADKETALKLQEQFIDASKSGHEIFCTRLMFSATQLSGQPVSHRTRNVMQAALKMKKPETDEPLVCSCDGSSNQAWLSELRQIVEELVLARDETDRTEDRLLKGVVVAQDDCAEPMLQAAAPDNDGAGAGPDAPAAQPLPGAGEDKAVKNPPAGAAGADAAENAAQACIVKELQERRRIRVFIQVPSEAMSAPAELLRRALNKKPPFKSPGIEIVGDHRSPKKAEVRYAYPNDLSAAQIVAEAIKACTRQGADVREMKRYRGVTDPGVLEVWLSAANAAEKKP